MSYLSFSPFLPSPPVLPVQMKPTDGLDSSFLLICEHLLLLCPCHPWTQWPLTSTNTSSLQHRRPSASEPGTAWNGLLRPSPLADLVHQLAGRAEGRMGTGRWTAPAGTLAGGKPTHLLSRGRGNAEQNLKMSRLIVTWVSCWFQCGWSMADHRDLIFLETFYGNRKSRVVPWSLVK